MEKPKFKIKRWMWVVGIIVVALAVWIGLRWYNKDVVGI